MRILFFGTPEEAVPFLETCLAIGTVVGAVTAPDRPRGRGRPPQPSAVKLAAIDRQVPVLQPEHCKDPDFLHQVRQLCPDVLVVVAYGQILPPELLEIPRVALNVHFSILPQLRGAAPVQRTLEWGLTRAGVSVQLMAPELDAGPVLVRRAVPVHAVDDAHSLRQRLIAVGTQCLKEVLSAIQQGQALSGYEQGHSTATYAPKVRSGELAADFEVPASIIAKRARAFSDSGGLYCSIDGKRLKLWRVMAVWRNGPGGSPGTVEADTAAGPVVSCGGHWLVLNQAQMEGRRKTSGADLLRGRVIGVGQQLKSGQQGSG
ncbi:MAG: methionyl-tRNA formyltransferase [Armatimonadetes bacterium]|nr:methionyl-tRNA formyltransferase [Armatimonadota bacterium]